MNQTNRSLHAMSNSVIETVEQTITAYRMLAPADSVLIGVSGGPDSVALVNVLLALAPRFDLLVFALRCFVLICFVLFCFALLCFDLLCFALLCFALLCVVLL